jgi:hypothetical protein
MAWTQTDLDNINAAISAGKRVFQKGGRRLEYQSLSDMLAARDAIKREVDNAAAEAAGTMRPRGYRARTGSKGL